jgi:hypothetical protein
MPTLRNGILFISFAGSEEQMLGIAAWRIVAFMQDIQTDRNGADIECKR